jgi:cell wall-associated NlpC family hydrolase
MQSNAGNIISFIHEIEPGDLAFFDNLEGEIIHVGIILHGGRIIHSSDYVRIDRLDQQGIFNVEKGKYTHKLRIIKRIASSL